MRTLITIIIGIIISLVSVNAKDINIKQINTNSSGIDVAPYLSIDGKFMVFGSDREGSEVDPAGKRSSDLWVMTANNETFSNPEAINSSSVFGNNFFNSKFLESSFTMTADGKFILFASCGRTDSYGDCDIYWSRLRDEGWSMPAPLGRSINSISWDGMPSISADGKTIFFVSNRKGSKSGSFDIWYSLYDSDMEEWQPAQNLTEVNTKFDDLCPFIAPDGLTLFFSSNGYEDSFGGLDLYTIKYDKSISKWGIPKNMGEPYNTTLNERYCAFDGSGSKMVFSRNDPTTLTIKEDFYIADVVPFFTPVQSFTLNAVSAETEKPVFVNFLGKTEKRKVFSTNGSSSRVLISQKDFELAPFIDIDIQTKNPNFEKQSKTIRVLNPAIMDENQRKEYLNKMNYTVNFALNEPGKPITLPKTISIVNTDLTIKDADNESKPVKEITVDECLVEKRKQVLNYIFFDENKSSIPDKYNLSSMLDGRKLTEVDLQKGNDLDTYYNILNIIGLRMSANTNININLTGCNSNKGKELKNLKLSKDRAQSVANYLSKEWGIAATRMNVTGRALPALANNEKSKEAAEENQRVEVTSDNPELFKDINSQEIVLLSNPKRIVVSYKTDFANATGDWEFTVETYDSTFKRIKGKNSSSNIFEWNASKDLEHLNMGNSKQTAKKIVKEEAKTDNQSEKSEQNAKPTFLENAKAALKKVGSELGKAARDFEKSLNSADEEQVRKAKAIEAAKKRIIFEIIANDSLTSKMVISKVDMPFKNNSSKGQAEMNKIYNYRFLVLDKNQGLTAEQTKTLDELSELGGQEAGKYIEEVKANYSNTNASAKSKAIETGTVKNTNEKQIENNANINNEFTNVTPEGRIYMSKSVVIEIRKK